jgi:alkylhydroperoxidase/carboxymuconolactone decarboxylase family protein YurZ
VDLARLAQEMVERHLRAGQLGLRTHVRAAREGAAVEEIVEVLELTAVLGLQSVAFGLPILNEELARLARPST